MARAPSERTVVLLIAAVQFVNILDFVMVTPLGPDFAAALGIPASHLGWVAGAYSAAGALSGLAGAFFLDRFDRRKALGVAMLGLVLGTLAGGLATGFGTLLAARVLAGLFGGPATSLSLSIVADAVPAERRGRAMGTVMSAFSIASIVGVPVALELALHGGWRAPFLAVGGLGALVAIGAVLLLPPLRGHLERGGAAGREAVGFGELLRRPEVLLSFAVVAASMMAGFLVIPNISPHVQGNLGFPRQSLDLVYTLGGVVSFLTLRVMGRLVDRHGSARVGLLGAGLLSATLLLGFVRFDLLQGTLGRLVAPLEGARLGVGPLSLRLERVDVFLPVLAVFLCFFLAMGTRNVANTTLTSRVPRGPERARYMSLQSFVQHLFMSLGAFVSSLLLSEAPGGGVAGMGRVALLSLGLTLLVPLLMARLERRLPPGRPPPGAPALTPTPDGPARGPLPGSRPPLGEAGPGGGGG
jgi:predicted MFS family arabinose efflux permease